MHSRSTALAFLAFVAQLRGRFPSIGTDAKELVQGVRDEGLRNFFLVRSIFAGLVLRSLGLDAAVPSLAWSGLSGWGGKLW